MSERKAASDMQWKVHTAGLFKEIVRSNQTTWPLRIPLQIMGSLLGQAAQRAAEIQDPQLLAIMCRLTLYEFTDPYSPEYDPERAERLMSAVAVPSELPHPG